jgi:hypothetical protein
MGDSRAGAIVVLSRSHGWQYPTAIYSACARRHQCGTNSLQLDQLDQLDRMRSAYREPGGPALASVRNQYVYEEIDQAINFDVCNSRQVY